MQKWKILSVIVWLGSAAACAKGTNALSIESDSEEPDPSGGTGGDASTPLGGSGPTSNAGSTHVGGTSSGGGGRFSGVGGIAGKGGSGSIGSAGKSSGGGAGGRSGAGGSAGKSGVAGSGGGEFPANGCASLTVPLTATTGRAHFVITLASGTNFSGATLSMRVYVKAGVGGAISNYVQDSTYKLLRDSTPAKLDTLSGWQTVT